MMKPYRIKRPIRNLESLRQEKRNLRLHIANADEALRDRIQNLPALAAIRTVQQVGSFFVQTTGGKAISALLGGGLKGKGFWKEILKGAALFAGTQLVKRYTSSRKSDLDEGDADEENGTNDEIPDLSE